jgi:hypothetical protein
MVFEDVTPCCLVDSNIVSRAVESVHKISHPDSFIKAQYVLIMVNLYDISSPSCKLSGYFIVAIRALALEYLVKILD